jgi:hypothetical protein
MSLLTCFFIWLCVSCVATPFIGMLLGAFDEAPEHARGNARSAESGLWPHIDGIAERAWTEAPAYISRLPRRKPIETDFALRPSRRMRR